MLRLFCVVVGQGRPFPMKIALDETVGELKDKIKDKKQSSFTFDADELELYLALTGPASWMSDEDSNSQPLCHSGGGNTNKLSWLSVKTPEFQILSQPAEGNSAMQLFLNVERKMLDTEKLSKFFSGGGYPKYCDDNKIHVVVVFPATKSNWNAEELSTIDPPVQLKHWKSVVKITIKDSFAPIDVATALVVDRTSTHVYLLTNLDLFLGEKYTNVLSSGFKRQLEFYLKLHRGLKANAKQKEKTACDSGPSTVLHDSVEVVIEQRFPDEAALKEVLRLRFSSDICWNCLILRSWKFLRLQMPNLTSSDVRKPLVSMLRCLYTYLDFLKIGKMKMLATMAPSSWLK
ncbi:hypothetical protein AeRB84_011904 [Aphanomyces euteiches]|nr:hypothetical protein AeRB84_011904 [Aphanomyces euteiches]